MGNRRHHGLVNSVAVLVILFSSLAGASSAQQTDKVPSTVATSAAVPRLTYEPPTKAQRFKTYAFDTYGPPALAQAAIRAAILQARDLPSQWGQGGSGFVERFGSVMGEEAISGTTRYLLSSALREDDRYLRCRGCSFGQKISNAFVSEFIARHGEDGHRVFSISKVVSPFAGPLVAKNTWYPGTYTDADAMREVAFSFGARFVVDMFREFLP